MVACWRPHALAEALAIRAREAVTPFAGGTDLMVKLRRGAGALPAFRTPILFLDRCGELRGIRAREGALEIGAMTTLHELAAHEDVPAALKSAVLQMGGPGLRTVATIGGNACNASPAGDTLPFLIAAGALVHLASAQAERTLPVSAFITGPGRTLLQPDEILRSVTIPAGGPSAWHWRKVGTRRANALTKVSLCAGADRVGGRLRNVRCALGAVGSTVVRLGSVESLLGDASAADLARLVPEVHALVREAVRPIDDQRSTAEYRREVAAALVCAFVTEALGFT